MTSFLLKEREHWLTHLVYLSPVQGRMSDIQSPLNVSHS